MKKFLLAFAVIFMTSNISYSQTDRYWSGGSGSSNNIDQGANWYGGTNPTSNDNLYYNNTITRFISNSNYGAGSFFNFLISYSGAGAINFTGDNSYFRKIENNNNASILTISNNTIGNRPNTNIEINPVGSGGLALTGSTFTMDCNNAGNPQLQIYGNNSLSISNAIVQSNTSGGRTASFQIMSGSTPSVTLTGANTYTGLTTINGGTLRLNRTGGTTLPATNNITVAGGTLRVSTNQTITDLSLSGGGNLTVDAGVTLTVTGAYTGGTGTINNQGTIILQGSSAQTFPGASTNINNGTSGQMTSLTIDNSAGVTLNRTFSIAGTLTLTSGTLTNSTFLTVSNSATITRFGGSLTAAPVFGTTGTDRVNVTITGNCTAGNELAGTTGGIGTLTVNNNATYTLNADRTLDAISVASGATIDGATFVLTPRASGAATIAGTFKTANLVGFSGNASAAISSTNTPTFTLTGSTIEYNAASASQVITPRSDYNNLTLSAGFAKAISASTTIGGNLNFNAAGDILVLGSNTLTLNGTVTGSGFLRGSLTSNVSIGGSGALGTINFDQSSDGTSNVLSNLTINRSSGTLSLGNKLVLIDVLTPTAGVLTTGGFLHLRSNTTNTARIAAGSSSGGYISGDVTAERFMTSNTNRAYRLLAPTATTASTIRSNWQEGVNNTIVNTNVNSPLAGYGTHITGAGGSADGFDVTQNNQASLFRFDRPTQNWVAVTNTNVNTLDAKIGYLAFIRGNRDNINTINTTTGSSNATLRATGTLAQGTQTFTSLADATLFSLVTNPYASPISWSSVYAAGSNTTNFENAINIWDPNVNTRGGYVTINNSGGITVTGGGPTNLTDNIQSGQAFFIQTKVGINSPTFTLLESNKSTTNNLDVYRTAPQTEILKVYLKYTNAGVERSADGVTAVFSNNYSNGVDGNDAEQIANWDEDVALLRGGKALSIESRDLVDANDTLFLKIERVNKTAATYKWEIQPQSFNAPGVQAWMKDNFTNTSTPISLTANTIINFTVTSDIASQASNRFSIVFKSNAALPVTISNVKAYTKNSGVQVEWQASNEINIESYEVEKSSNAINFTTLNSQAATGSNQYQSFDANPNTGNNFYRIKVIEKSGSSSYTQIVKVTTSKTQSDISIYPNPVTNNQVGLQLNKVAKGTYQVRIINKIGQTLFTKTIAHAGGTASHQLQLNNSTLSSGVYQLLVEGEGIQFTQTLFKQ